MALIMHVDRVVVHPAELLCHRTVLTVCVRGAPDVCSWNLDNSSSSLCSIEKLKAPPTKCIDIKRAIGVAEVYSDLERRRAAFSGSPSIMINQSRWCYCSSHAEANDAVIRPLFLQGALKVVVDFETGRRLARVAILRGLLIRAFNGFIQAILV